MDKPRIAILGGRGMLGSDLASVSREQGFDPILFDLPGFDITNADHVRQAVSRAGMIVNCAAYTNVDGAESEPEWAFQVNAEAVGRLGAIVREAGKWLMHISTDFVFDGKSDQPYVETDSAHPINTYGKSKLAGEELLAESGCRYCIMRVEWTYGLAGNNFVTKLLQRARAGNALKVVDDQVGSPTATLEVSKTICELLKSQPEDLFHFAAAGYVSRYDMAKCIVNKLSMDVDVAPCKTSDFPSPATRPLNSRFDCSKISRLLSEPIKHWQEPLERFLGQL
ncbi:MAG: dTDP-4-dehydrorhamnose reductase [Sedimentisphaerales bacterium]|nr:dTDP-4-dehydrorhamnose reductase [Sedimentisphaerales bacterium]